MTTITAPKMVYVLGEEMTRYGMELILDQWVKPHVDISAWEFYDLSCKARDDSDDQVLRDLVDAGQRVGAIFKEPTITPTEVQKEALGLKKAWGSPNGVIRRGWNGVTISRDTIMIDGLKLGYDKPVLFDRHAVGGEYGGGFAQVGAGKSVTTYYPADGGAPQIVDERELTDSQNALVTYHNPLDGVEEMAHHFFSRTLAAGVTPYVTTKKTVFKWQESFWQIMKDVFDKNYGADFKAAGLLDGCGGELQHLISDAACMEIPKWTDGGFAMCSHNYDGDMLTDLMAVVHRSPGFISSALIGRSDSGEKIMEFEASHGTVSAMEKRRLEGGETSMNPIGMVYALAQAMKYSAERAGCEPDCDVCQFADVLTNSMYEVMIAGDRATRDMAGPTGATTEAFVADVASVIAGKLA